MNKKYPYTAVNLILLLLLLSCIMLFVIKKKTEQKILTSNHLLKDKLDLSVVLLGNYVDSALQKTNEALILSTLSNQKEYQIQSLELLSAIKNIKGQTNQSLDMYEH